MSNVDGSWRGSATVAFTIAVLLASRNSKVEVFTTTCSQGTVCEEIVAQPRILAPWESPRSAFLDYEYLHERLREEYGWDEAHVHGALVEYLRFMQLLAESPKMELVASSDVDLVWHEHLLDSKNYEADCKNLWGRFLHHRRARSHVEIEAIPMSYAHTKIEYRRRFNQEPPVVFWGHSTKAASMCGGGSALDPSANRPVQRATTQAIRRTFPPATSTASTISATWAMSAASTTSASSTTSTISETLAAVVQAKYISNTSNATLTSDIQTKTTTMSQSPQTSNRTTRAVEVPASTTLPLKASVVNGNSGLNLDPLLTLCISCLAADHFYWNSLET